MSPSPSIYRLFVVCLSMLIAPPSMAQTPDLFQSAPGPAPAAKPPAPRPHPPRPRSGAEPAQPDPVVAPRAATPAQPEPVAAPRAVTPAQPEPVVAPRAATPAGSGNRANNNLLAMSPDQQAKLLTKGIQGCDGESPFAMGVTVSGKAKDYAYWSVRCKDGRSFAVQITPAAKATAADCRALEGTGRECFKKF